MHKQTPISQFTFLPLTSHHNARFVFSLLIAFALHLLVIFQISFKLPEKKPHIPLSLDIIINPLEKEQKIKTADYFAQSNQLGGGQQESKVKPSNVISPRPEPDIKKIPLPPAPIKATPATQKTQAKKHKIQNIKKPSQFSVETKAKNKAEKLRKKETKKIAKTKPKIMPKTAPKIRNKPKINRQYLANLKQQIIDLEADIDLNTRVYSKRSKHKYLNASTAKAVDAQYIRQWTRKIERIGNLNYPAAARKKGIYGKLILSVTLAPNGKLLSIKVRKSSKHKTLDDAAIHIVKLSAPFAPIPKAVLQQNNALVITRTWLFTQKSNGQFRMN